MQQAQDFLDESMALNQLLSGLSDADYDQPTQFKGWTINMILRHLHVWNSAAGLSLTDAEAFVAFLKDMAVGIKGGSLPQFEEQQLNGLSGIALRDVWTAEAELVAARFAQADPSARLPWVGPSMSARSSITARLMESWAHGQAIYDRLGVDRIDSDRIGNIVRLGVNTYEWCFRNRRIDIPGPMPKLQLIAPSGTVWTYGEGEGGISGLATEFCQVVTQTRNVRDTALIVDGEVAEAWMAIAQCFAGPPVDPPAVGTRFRQHSG
jgi:uncharacterized protein (TIGR03084 family)